MSFPYPEFGSCSELPVARIRILQLAALSQNPDPVVSFPYPESRSCSELPGARIRILHCATRLQNPDPCKYYFLNLPSAEHDVPSGIGNFAEIKPQSGLVSEHSAGRDQRGQEEFVTLFGAPDGLEDCIAEKSPPSRMRRFYSKNVHW